jgi:hypothetical protein
MVRAEMMYERKELILHLHVVSFLHFFFIIWINKQPNVYFYVFPITHLNTGIDLLHVKFDEHFIKEPTGDLAKIYQIWIKSFFLLSFEFFGQL